MRTEFILAALAATTLLLSPSGHAKKIEERKSAVSGRAERMNIKELHASANAGNPQAQFTLGLIYEEGRGGTKRDLAYALSWYEEAARNGLKLASDKIQKLTSELE